MRRRRAIARRRRNQDLKEKEKASDAVREGETELSERKIVSDSNPSKSDLNEPPSDDYCPICFGTFVVPYRAQCGHWYCGGCILEYWSHSAVILPCKCPMCSQRIRKLTPMTSMDHWREEGVNEALEKIWKYNHLFGDSTYGFIHKVVLVVPLIIEIIVQDMTDPDRALRQIYKARSIAIIMGALYTFCSKDLKIGSLNTIDYFDYCAISMVVIMHLVNLCRSHSHSLLQRVRQLAALRPCLAATAVLRTFPIISKMESLETM